jgi:hypothetical protein
MIYIHAAAGIPSCRDLFGRERIPDRASKLGDIASTWVILAHAGIHDWLVIIRMIEGCGAEGG